MKTDLPENKENKDNKTKPHNVVVPFNNILQKDPRRT